MSFEKEMMVWNSRFPMDRWFRKKYNIPFNSPAHREISFLDQLREYQEDMLFKKISIVSDYKPNTGDFIKEPEFDSKEEKEAYIAAKAQDSFDNFDEEIEE